MKRLPGLQDQRLFYWFRPEVDPIGKVRQSKRGINFNGHDWESEGEENKL